MDAQMTSGEGREAALVVCKQKLEDYKICRREEHAAILDSRNPDGPRGRGR